MKVFDKITNLLIKNNVEFEHYKHDFIHKSTEAALIRGNDIKNTAKAIVMKYYEEGQKKYVQFVLQGDKKINTKRLKKLGFKKLGLASPEEVLKVTGCAIGSVPPFGNLFELQVIVDVHLKQNEYIYFSAGTHYDSIKIKFKDYEKVVKPKIMDATS